MSNLELGRSIIVAAWKVSYDNELKCRSISMWPFIRSLIGNERCHDNSFRLYHNFLFQRNSMLCLENALHLREEVIRGMASKYRQGKYNWFGQKLLATHRYDEIILLHNHLAYKWADGNEQSAIASCPVSEHINYLNALASMKINNAPSKLNDIIMSLQGLNFDKNSQYFMVLCQCLLYLGNYDSVVALCKQIINKEIDSYKAMQSVNAEVASYNDSKTDIADLSQSDLAIQQREEEDWDKIKLCLESLAQETNEFKKIFANINRNHLINEPKLWFIFGLCLEFQCNFKDAHFAYRVASKLASGNFEQNLIDNHRRHKHRHQDKREPPVDSDHKAASMNYYFNPHVKYAEFCIKFGDDFRTSIQVLNKASLMFPQNYCINPQLALIISANKQQQSTANNNLQKSLKILSKLEAHSALSRNPATDYNKLASRFKRKSQQMLSNCSDSNCHLIEDNRDDKSRYNLNYLLIKTHVSINSLIQELQFKLPIQSQSNYIDPYQATLLNEVDKLIDSMKQSDSSCWLSASLWNNLGLCYLVKRRLIACLSCLAKAHSINPLDWRINYNLALAYMRAGLINQAFNSLISAKNLNQQQQNPLVKSLLANCYEYLNQTYEARRLYIEIIRPYPGNRKTSSSTAPVINTLINYLMFLHKDSDNSNDLTREQNSKLKLYLIDQLEQAWLQRYPQNDPQFNIHLLMIAKRIGEEINQNNANAKKNYAWAKGDDDNLSTNNQ